MPEDFKIIHHVFTAIVAEPWFTRSQSRREQFAAEIVDTYRQGVTHREVLQQHCWNIAHQHYGDGGFD